jgi:hypothetical protein
MFMSFSFDESRSSPTAAFSCGARSASELNRKKLLEKHAIAPSAARLCYAARLRLTTLPRIAPKPIRPTLAMGMIGPRKFLTAISAATTNPINPPKNVAP